jgi:cytochrome c-type biogenesis protein CcmE
MKPKHQRLVLVIIALAMVGAAVSVVLRNLEDYVVYFYAPSDVVAHPPPFDRYVRVGGLVKEGSIVHDGDMTIRFTVTDYAHDLVVTYRGIVPGLFRAGQGVVAEGYVQNGAMVAKMILAKHDEYYMPPEVAKSLKKSGHWKGEEGYGKPETKRGNAIQ